MNLLGKKIIGVSGAMFPDREGEVVEWENNDIVGAMFWVRWEDGSKEPFQPHQFKPLSEKCGIGVYYQN